MGQPGMSVEKGSKIMSMTPVFLAYFARLLVKIVGGLMTAEEQSIVIVRVGLGAKVAPPSAPTLNVTTYDVNVVKGIYKHYSAEHSAKVIPIGTDVMDV